MTLPHPQPCRQTEWSSDRHGRYAVRAREVVDPSAEHRPHPRRLRAVAAAREHLVDLAPVLDHSLDLALGLDPLVQRIELAAQAVRRPVQLTEGVVQRILLVAGCSLLAFAGLLLLAA